jgi:pSer/pThr/pTyr-binding forkhead associated (FHA) protein
MPHRSAFGLKVGDAEAYRALPASMADEAARNPLLTRWRIEINGLGPGIPPQGVDVCGDVVLGRSAQNVDVDLTPFHAVEHGVSRRHAMLRPSSSKLYLIDLGSTNGTRCNSVVVSGARALQHLDTISLGGLTFQLRIIDQR